MCIVKKSPRSSLRLFSLPLISVRGVSLKPSFERKQHLMSPPIFFAPFFYQTFFPPLFTKIFFLPHNTSSTRFFNPSQPHIFFLFPFPLSKKLPAFNAFKQKFFCPISAQLSWLVLIMDDLLVYPFLKPEIPPLERSLLNYPSLKLVDSIFGQIFLRFSFRKILLLRAKTVFPC